MKIITIELDPYIGSLKQVLTLKGEFEIFPTSKIDEINKENNTDFAPIFFDILIGLFNKEYLSVYAVSNQSLTEMSYIRGDIINDHDKFRAMVTKLRADLTRNSPNPLERKYEEYCIECISSSEKTRYINELLFAHNNLVKSSENRIEFPPTRAGRIKIIDYIVELLEENGEAMEYNQIIKEFDTKFSEIKRTNYRSLKDAMDLSELTISLGGRSNYYILTKWEERYFTGPYKELIIKHMEGKNIPEHFYEIFRDLSEGRPEMRVSHISNTLAHLTDVFKYYSGGFYSLLRENLNSGYQYKRLHVGVYNLIEENKTVPFEKLLKLLKNRYSEYQDIQLEYAIFMGLE